MAITRDQTSTLAQVGSGASVTTTWGSNPTAGSSVIVWVQLDDNPTSVTDNGVTQSTFTRDTISNVAGTGWVHVYRADGISLPASGSYSVTVNYTPGSATIQAIGQSYLGKKPGGPTATNAGTGTSSAPASGSVTSNAGGALFVAGFMDGYSGTSETISLSSAGWNSLASIVNGSSYWAGGFADFIGAAGSANSSQASWSLGDSPVWGATIAVYEATGGITRDQASTIGQVGSGASVTTSWSTAPAAGSSVLVFVQCVVPITSVTDNGSPSRTFTLDAQSPNSTDGGFIYRADNVQPSGTYTVTVTPSASGHTIQAWGQSYLNKKPGGPTATNSAGGTGTSVSTGAAAPAAAGGLVFGGFSDDSALNPETITFTGSAPQTQQQVVTNGSSFACMAVADALTGSSQNFTWTIGDSVPWGGCAAAYDTAGTGGGGATPPAFVASYSPASGNWTSSTSPKSASVTANAGDILIVLGGTQDARNATLGTPSDGTNTYALQQSQAISGACAGYAWAATISGTAALTVITSSLPNAVDSTPYSQTIQATGGSGTGYTWSVSAGALPGWASLSAGGVLSGTPTGTGTASFTVKVTDSLSHTATQVFSITTSAASSLLPTWDPSGSLNGPYTLTLSEEFTGTSLNTVIWGAGWQQQTGISPPVNSGVSPQNNSAYVSVSGGYLNMKVDASYGSCVTSNTNGTGGSTGFSFTYPSAIEFRANLPGSGSRIYNWPALWTDGQSWPGNGEIDVMEGLGGTTAAHVHDNATDGPSGTGAPGIDHAVSAGWHTFGAHWAHTSVTFYYDGVSIGSLATDGFAGPHYIILTSTFNGSLDNPATMQVDYVRVWTATS